MFQHLRGMSRSRLLNKFVENEFEKVDRLLELHFKYRTRVADGDKELERKRQELLASGEEVDADEMEDELYVTRLDNGLFRLQQVDLSLAHLCVSGVAEVGGAAAAAAAWLASMRFFFCVPGRTTFH